MKRAFVGLLMFIAIMSGLHTVSFAEREFVGGTALYKR